MNIKYSNNY